MDGEVKLRKDGKEWVTDEFFNPSCFGNSKASNRLAWRLTELRPHLARKATRFLQHYINGIRDIVTLNNNVEMILTLWKNHYTNEINNSKLPDDVKLTCRSIIYQYFRAAKREKL